jgi:hypothetical protein
MPSVRRAVAFFLAVFYFFSQPVLGSSLETNLWKERRQLASFSAPSGLTVPSALRSNLPDVSAVSPVSFGTIPPVLQPLLRGIPLSAVTVQDVWAPIRSAGAPVLLIQDIHLNSEAQKNISVLLQALLAQNNAGAVAIEGAFGPLPIKPFRDFPDKTIVNTVARSLLEHGMLAAPTFVAMTSADEPPPFVGVDDRAHHRANIDAYLQAQAGKPAALAELDLQEEQLAVQKRKFFSAELMRFDGLRAAHEQGTLGLGAYAQALARISESPDLTIDQFLQTVKMEKELDFQAVERQRQRVIGALSKKLNRAELQDLVDRSLAYRAGRLGFGDYYRSLRRLCKNHGIVLSHTRAFDDYIRYVLLADGINAVKLFDAMGRWEAEIIEQLATTPAAQRTAKQSKLLSLARKLTDFALTSQEWESYRRTPRVADLKNFERFYEEADIRSGKLVDGLMSLRAEHPQSPTVLVAGGFHTPEIAQLLKRRGVSYVVVSPKITKVDGAASSYLSVFAREKAPLEKLFEGDRLLGAPRAPQKRNPGSFAGA